MRPDTIVVASGCTFLIGEDKVDELHAVEADLRSKIKPLNPMFYGELGFILGYIAIGTKFQWVYIGKNGSNDLHRINRVLDLSNLASRYKFLLSLGCAFWTAIEENGKLCPVCARAPRYVFCG